VNKFIFVASLFVGAGCCLFVGSIDLYERSHFWIDGQSGVMESSDPIIAHTLKYNPDVSSRTADVAYVTPSGSVPVPHKRLMGNLLKRLNEGQRIPVVFLKSDPQRALFDGEQLENPWGWLVVGVCLSGVAPYALRLLKKEAAARAQSEA
jgi:hypothetical protein